MELTPKQQVVELIRQANKILLITSREPNNDQLASMVALQLALSKQGKQVQAVISDKLPRIAQLFNNQTKQISRNLTGVRDFVVTLKTDNVEVDQLQWHRDTEANKLNIVVTPHSGNFEERDATFSHGAFQFDLVIALGVTHFDKIDRLIDENPTVFDGLHVANIDYHRINNNWGSVNLIDQLAGSTAEMLVSVLESLEQSIIDADIATALLAGIMAATNRFTSASTTPKAMTVAAQLLAAGARQQDVVKMLYENGGEAPRDTRDQQNRDQNPRDNSRDGGKKNEPRPNQQQNRQPQNQSNQRPSQPNHQSAQPSRNLNTAPQNHSSKPSPKPITSPANRPAPSAAASKATASSQPQQMQNPTPTSNSQSDSADSEYNSYSFVQTFDSADQRVSV